jgi:uncharacterized membrane protein YhaH (DUF805 family)
MSFIDAVESAFSKYVTVSGRASRSEYWWFVAFCMAISLIAGVIEGINGSSFPSLVITLVTFIPGITVGVRRLHDKDRSGWWLLIVFVPLIGWLILLYWNVTRGTFGANRFGPDPVSTT